MVPLAAPIIDVDHLTQFNDRLSQPTPEALPGRPPSRRRSRTGAAVTDSTAPKPATLPYPGR